MSAGPSWIYHASGQISDVAGRKWAVAQLAAQIAPGFIALTFSPDGMHRGTTNFGVAQASIEVAELILDQVGLPK